MNEPNFTEILSHFSINLPLKPFGNGHINTTFQVGDPPCYILQKINTAVFADAEGLMENVMAVTNHLRRKIAEEGGAPERETLTYLKTEEGSNFYRDAEGNCWRMYRFIGDAHAFETATPKLFAESARAFGNFQKMLADFPADTLHETIPQFHDTAARLKQLRAAVLENKSGRADAVGAEIEFAFARAGEADTIVSALQNGEIPLRVTHNDTKLNNVLFDDQTDKTLCVIDLDTVMPGSLLYDYGDALRFGASTAAEDETDLAKVQFDLELFRAYTDAYLETLAGSITEREIDLLPMGAKLITLECGMRFLADYINGDVYFRIHRENQNLDRARTQFKLVADMESKFDEMKAIVRTAKEKYCCF
ncbi:MAG: aminoglycoside phosphotransferase family protein [Ruminococcaceae bacterium]|nr:aminoglycoside phosphotransferase family protein [Oscillospiraceae bacterium]